MLELEKPKCVIIDHDENFFGKGLMINNKCPVIALQHEAVLHGDSNHAHIKGSNKGRPLPTVKCTSGPESKKILLKECNYPANRIAITGRSEFDDLINKDYIRHKTDTSMLDLKSPVVLYAPEYVRVTKRFYEAVKNIEGFQFIIKPHPVESMKNFHNTNNVKVFDKKTDVHELLRKSDLLITSNCTVALEALWGGIPVINYNPFNELDPWRLKDNGVPEATTDEELIKLIKNYRKIKIGAKTKKYLFGQLYKNDGKATKRIVGIIKCLT
jgi:CDP-glycerol glycerophosphotransferase (TagB/SpsB family)